MGLENIRRTCAAIQQDMVRDVHRDEGAPFNGETVARALGEIRAAVHALAGMLAEVSRATEVQ